MTTPLGLAIAFAASGGCTAGGEFAPALCPTGLAPRVEIRIGKTGARAPGGTDDRRNCAAFRPSVAQIKTYLRKAGKTDPASADATIDNSPCYAYGKVRFADGRRADWRIKQAGFGTLSFARGGRMLLYCPTCRWPFLID